MNETVTAFSRITFEVTAPAEIVVQVAVADRPGLAVADENLVVPGAVSVVPDRHGGRQHLIRLAPGTVTVAYSASVSRTGSGRAEVSDLDRIEALRPSRYCPSDRLTEEAERLAEPDMSTLDKVRAVRDHVHAGVEYVPGASGPTTDAADTLRSGQGVCRDFAHLVVALCRALGLPARVAAVYAPGLSPMDFHLVAEVLVDGAWTVWDATGLAPRPAFLRIATGRDAADVAFATTLSGTVELAEMEITAVTDGDLPADDPAEAVHLP